MVYVILGKGFEEVEAVAPVDILRRGGVEVKYAGINGMTVEGAHGIEVKADMRIEDVSAVEGDVVVVPGGLGGVETIESSTEAQRVITSARAKGCRIAAICAGPRVYAGLGLLGERNITCYPGMEAQMTGSVWKGGSVCVDGDLLTGRAPGSAIDFGLALLEWIAGNEKAGKVRAELVYDR